MRSEKRIEYRLGDLAQIIGALVDGDADIRIAGMADLAGAKAGELCFAESDRYLSEVEATAAGAVIVGEDFPVVRGPCLLRAAEPRRAFLEALRLFEPDRRLDGVHPSAVIAGDVNLPPGTGVGPGVVIEQGVEIGGGCQIRAGAFIGRGTRIGADCDIGENVVIREDTLVGEGCRLHPGVVLGADGYGYQWDGERHRKIPQIGRVVLEDDVEIGANSCVDRATLGETRIGRGSRLDNLVQVGHNNRLGRNVLLVSQVGIAGSCRIGDGVVAGGQVGIADHLDIGDGVQIAAQGGVIGDLDPGAKVWGTPARPMTKVLREHAAVAKLPELLRLVRRQEKELQALRDRIALLEKDGAA